MGGPTFPANPRVLTAGDKALRESEDALLLAERSGDDFALAQARGALGMLLVHRDAATERSRGHQLLVEVSEMCRAQDRP